jgi:hypothetical protein
MAKRVRVLALSDLPESWLNFCLELSVSSVDEAASTLPLVCKQWWRKVGKCKLLLSNPIQPAVARRVTDEVVQATANIFPGVVVMNLQSCQNITDAGVQALSALSGLKHLNLSGCDKITDAGVQALSALSSLQHLNLVCCGKITDAGVQALSALSDLQHL